MGYKCNFIEKSRWETGQSIHCGYYMCNPWSHTPFVHIPMKKTKRGGGRGEESFEPPQLATTPSSSQKRQQQLLLTVIRKKRLVFYDFAQKWRGGNGHRCDWWMDGGGDDSIMRLSRSSRRIKKDCLPIGHHRLNKSGKITVAILTDTHRTCKFWHPCMPRSKQ